METEIVSGMILRLNVVYVAVKYYTSSLVAWQLSMIDAESAFLQAAQAERDVFFVPQREYAERQFYWLLSTEACGLVNANTKLQNQSDELLYSVILQQVTAIPQPFYLTVDGHLVLI